MRSRRLAPLVKVTAERKDAASEAMARSSRTLAEQQQRYELLRQYRDEYATTPISTDSLVLPHMLANRQAFNDRLAKAVKEQEEIVQSSQQRVEVDRAKLIHASQEKHVIERLVQGYRTIEARAEGQREQRVLDDLGARCRNERAVTAEETAS